MALTGAQTQAAGQAKEIEMLKTALADANATLNRQEERMEQEQRALYTVTKELTDAQHVVDRQAEEIERLKASMADALKAAKTQSSAPPTVFARAKCRHIGYCK